MTANRPGRLLATIVLTVLLVAGCARAPAPSGTSDPHEAVNRLWFERNLALDRALPGGEERAEPSAAVRAAGNFGENLGLPSVILNDLLQVRPDRAFENTIRLAINTTVGLGGLFDPAGAMGIHGRSTDFGETLHRWGVGEGDYVVLPFFGPSTQRDAAGMVVDLALDPLRQVLPRGDYGRSLFARLIGRLAGRAEYADLLDANVINTADPYAQARLLYLQTRRYHLGVQAEDEIIDPYADF